MARGRRPESSALEQARLQAARERARLEVLRRQAIQQQQAQREEQQRRQEEKMREVSLRNSDLNDRLRSLQELLTTALKANRTFDLDRQKRTPKFPAFDPGGLNVPERIPSLAEFMPPSLGGAALLRRLFPRGRERERLAREAAQRRYEAALKARDERERQRQAMLARKREEHKAECRRIEAEVRDHNAEIDQIKAGYAEGEASSVRRYFQEVLDADTLPNYLPMAAYVEYEAERRQLRIERQLPTHDCIPRIVSYRYVKSSDRIMSTARSQHEIAKEYSAVIARLVLRTLHVVFTSDTAKVVESVALNGFVEAIDRSVGKPIRPYLTSVVVSREQFDDIVLEEVDPVLCLKQALKGRVSPSTHELVPIEPLVRWHVVDHRFVEGQDVMAQLDDRANLALLTYEQFEHLIRQLFESMGYQARTTQRSHDGGVDVYAWRPDAVLGGIAIIQAKRYRRPIGRGPVHELYGLVIDKGASKGILVTTSRFTSGAEEAARGKPIELYDGSYLRGLLQRHMGLRARIEFPPSWSDPRGTHEDEDG
jgi:restriction system protein